MDILVCKQYTIEVFIVYYKGNGCFALANTHIVLHQQPSGFFNLYRQTRWYVLRPTIKIVMSGKLKHVLHVV